MERFSVFEVLNENLRERYLVLFAGALESLESSHKTRRPPAISHWGGADRIVYREVEGNMALNEAKDFLSRYAEVMRVSGYRAILDRSG